VKIQWKHGAIVLALLLCGCARIVDTAESQPIRLPGNPQSPGRPPSQEPRDPQVQPPPARTPTTTAPKEASEPDALTWWRNQIRTLSREECRGCTPRVSHLFESNLEIARRARDDFRSTKSGDFLPALVCGVRDDHFESCVAIRRERDGALLGSGALIKQKEVLTAWHVVEDFAGQPAAIRVIVDRNADSQDQARIYTVAKIHRHDQCDMAVLVLEHAVTQAEPSSPVAPGALNGHASVVVVGFGTDRFNQAAQGRRQRVKVYLKEAPCDLDKAPDYGCRVPYEFVGDGKDGWCDACSKDSGGAVYVHADGADEGGGPWRLVGIVKGPLSKSVRDAIKCDRPECGCGHIYTYASYESGIRR
jgi:hypothetical protein